MKNDMLLILLSNSAYSNDLMVTGVIVLALALIILFIRFCIKQNEKEEERKRINKEKIENYLKDKANKYNNARQSFILENGLPDKTIIIEENEINSVIDVFESKKQVFILGKKYDFNDIISCDYTDNSRIIKGKSSSVTSSKTGSTIGRAIVGGIVAGPAGAIIGGATAKKHTEYKQGNDVSIHNYTVIINVKSISEPVISIKTGRNENLTNDIVGLMNVIISMK